MVRPISRLRAMIGLYFDGVFLFLMSLGTGADLLPWALSLGCLLRSVVDWLKIQLELFRPARGWVLKGSCRTNGGYLWQGVSGLALVLKVWIACSGDRPPHQVGKQ